MRKTIGIMTMALLALTPGGRVQAQEAKAAEEEKAPGKRLRVLFQESRRRGESTVSTRTSALTLHADAGEARVFVGTQAAITVAEANAPTTVFKNAGIQARVTATTLADGRYRLDAAFEESSVLAAGGGNDKAAMVTGGNPLLQVVKGESRITLREGETAPFASAVDPVTGEEVRVDLAVAAAPLPRAAPAAGAGPGRLRARLVLLRRQGETTIARRPYSVSLEVGGEGAGVFGGSMLPVQTRINDMVTIALKDVGAGLRLKAGPVPDGRYRLDVEFSDGVLAPGRDAPQIRTFESESRLFVREGETVTVASAVDPQTGDVVEAELSLEAVP